MAVEHPDGNFYAVEGEIVAVNGRNRDESKSPWTIFLGNRNPNTATMELKSDESMVSGAYNMFIINRKGSGTSLGDVALNSGKTAGNLYILRIGFLDGTGENANYIPVDDSVSFNAPEGFNESSVRFVELGVGLEGDRPRFDDDMEELKANDIEAMWAIAYELPRFMNGKNSENQWGWWTNETDGFMSPYLGKDVSLAQQLVLEFASPPPGTVQLIWMSDANSWDWTQEVIIEPGSGETMFTITLDSVFNNYSDWGKSDQFKIFLGYFGPPCDNCDGEGRCDAGCDRNAILPGTIPDLELTRAYFIINE
jgi:hypothetical protein